MSPPADPDRGRARGVGSRREARERALALLYEAEAKSVPPAQVVDELVLPPDSVAILVRD